MAGGRARRRLRLERHFDGRLLRCFSERPPHIDAFFRASVARFPEKPALVAGARRIAYAELDRMVEHLAGNLARRGIAPGDRVALLLGNCPEFPAAVLACARLGAIAMPIGTRQKGPELEYLLADSGATLLIFESGLAENLPAREAMAGVRLVAVGGPIAGTEPIAVLLEAAPPPPAPAIAEEDTAIILYTSGTTGKPKGAMLSHLNVVHSVIHFTRCLGLGPEDRAMLAVPAAHVTGTVAILLSTIYFGGTTVMLPVFKARDFLALAAAERITFTCMVPAMYILCLMDPEFERFDLGAWRVGSFGGAPMPEATIAALAEKLPRLQLGERLWRHRDDLADDAHAAGRHAWPRRERGPSRALRRAHRRRREGPRGAAGNARRDLDPGAHGGAGLLAEARGQRRRASPTASGIRAISARSTRWASSASSTASRI